MSDPLIGLVRAIDRQVQVASGKYTVGRKLGVFVILGDAPGRADQLQELARKESLGQVSLCIGAAPPRYEVSPEAEGTVVIYNPARPGRQSVLANFAWRQGELNPSLRDA